MESYIQLAYRLYIGPDATNFTEKKILSDTYSVIQEKGKSFAADTGLTRFSEILKADPRANALHQDCRSAALQHLHEFGGLIPGLTDVQGQLRFAALDPAFRIEESDLNDPSHHRCSIVFHTDFFELLHPFDDMLLLRKPGSNDSFTLWLQPELTVTYWEMPVQEAGALSLGATG